MKRIFLFSLLALLSCSKSSDSGSGSAGGASAGNSEVSDEELRAGSASAVNSVTGANTNAGSSSALPTLRISGSENQTIVFDPAKGDSVRCGKQDGNFQIWAMRKVDDNKTTLMIVLANGGTPPRGTVAITRDTAETAGITLITRPGDKYWAPATSGSCETKFLGNSRSLRVSLKCKDLIGVARAGGDKEKVQLEGDFVCALGDVPNILENRN